MKVGSSTVQWGVTFYCLYQVADHEWTCDQSMLSCICDDVNALSLQSVTGSKMESVCDLAHITLNKNAIFGDTSALTPGGVRIGAPAMTSRGLVQYFYHCHSQHHACLHCCTISHLRTCRCFSLPV